MGLSLRYTVGDIYAHSSRLRESAAYAASVADYVDVSYKLEAVVQKYRTN